MSKKLNYPFVNDSFVKAGFDLLEDKYINVDTKVKYKCSNEHTHKGIIKKKYNFKGV